MSSDVIPARPVRVTITRRCGCKLHFDQLFASGPRQPFKWGLTLCRTHERYAAMVALADVRDVAIEVDHANW